METRRRWLIDLREKANYTRMEAAYHCGVHVTYIAKIEDGERRPSPEVAQKLGKLLGFDWTRFYPPVSA
jgi:transcriptional regulator with XRE-family HTH domain